MHDENKWKTKETKQIAKRRKIHFGEAQKRTKARILGKMVTTKYFAWHNIHLIEHLKARRTIYDPKMVEKMSTALKCFSTSISR